MAIHSLPLDDGFLDLLLKALDQPLPAPRLDRHLEDEEEQDVDAHQAPGAPGAHLADLVAPDLLFMVAGQDGFGQRVARFFGGFLVRAELVVRALFGLFVGVVASVEAGEAFEVGGAPVVFALEEVVDFALGVGAGGDGGGVGGTGGFDGLSGGGDELFLGFDGFFECFDAGVAGQVVEALGGGEDVGLDIVHEMGEAFGEVGAA